MLTIGTEIYFLNGGDKQLYESLKLLRHCQFILVLHFKTLNNLNHAEDATTRHKVVIFIKLHFVT
jgi:hypothetical protein